MPVAIRKLVRERAEQICGYCQPSKMDYSPFHQTQSSKRILARVSRKISKVLTTQKIESVTKWTWSGTRFVRESPSEKQAAAPNRLQLYKRARYYDPTTGEFISRDPLGYVDGMSLYRGYFVPGGMDPWGLQDEVSDLPAPEFWSYDDLNERDAMSYDEYLDWFRDRHPKMQHDKWAQALADGCIGITECNLGVREKSDLTKQCYRTRAEADKVFANLKCPGYRKKMYSIHLWTGHGGDDKRNPENYNLKTLENGTVNLEDWQKGTNPDTTGFDPDGRPSGKWNENDGTGTNFDVGWVTNDDDGTMLHANNLHDPNGERYLRAKKLEMLVFKTTQEDWNGKNFYGDFDTEVWCVKCQKEDAECVRPRK